MQIKPVKTTAAPQYPKREAVSAEQIKISVPLRWANSRTAKAALATLAAMSLAGCTRTAGVPIAPSPTTEETVTQTPIITDVLPGEAMAPTISVAPLFEHGDGMGAFGCDMVTPPVFLTEDEALSVINNVAKEYGITFSVQGAPALTGVLEPVTNIFDPENKAASDTLVTLTPDFADAQHGIVLEYVSVEDVRAWHQDQGFASSVESYDVLMRRISCLRRWKARYPKTPKVVQWACCTTRASSRIPNPAGTGRRRCRRQKRRAARVPKRSWPLRSETFWSG